MTSQRKRFSTILGQGIFICANLLFFLTPFIFTWMNQELFEFSKMLFVYLLTTLLLGLWGARMVVEQRFIYRHHWLHYLLLAFLLSQLVATVFSLHPRTSWFGYYSRFNGGLLSTLSYMAIYLTLVSNLGKKQFAIIAGSLILAATLVSAYAIPEKFDHSPSCLLLTQQFDTNCWSDNNNPRYRVFATFGQPNWLAAFLVGVLPLVLHRLLLSKKLRTQLLYLTVSGVIFWAILLTGSRSALLALLVTTPLWVGVLWRRRTSRHWPRIQQPLHKLLLVGLVFGLLTLNFATELTGQLADIIGKRWPLDRMSTEQLAADPNVLPPTEGGTPSDEIRQVVWQGALRVWQRYPLFGSGVETFAYSYYLDRPVAHNLLSEWDFLYNKAHNELLNILATTGLFGLITYLGIFAGASVVVWRIWRHKQAASLAVTIWISLSALFVTNFFGFSTVTVQLLLFLLLAWLVSLDQEKIPSPKLSEQPLSGGDYLALAAIISAVLISSHQLKNIWQADYLFTRGQALFSQNPSQNGLRLMEAAAAKAPDEALFIDELSQAYAQLALQAAAQQQAEETARLAQQALSLNQRALSLNPAHLNFHKSRARLFIRLGQIDSRLYQEAAKALRTAIQLAPSDAKLYYNLGLIEEVLGDIPSAIKQLQTAIDLKSNYLQARNELARLYLQQNELELAKAQFEYSLRYIAPDDEPIARALEVIEASLSAQQR